MVKNPPANAGDVRCGFDSWVEKTPLEEGMATHSSILAWRIPMDREAYSPSGCKELDMTETIYHAVSSLSHGCSRILQVYRPYQRS